MDEIIYSASGTLDANIDNFNQKISEVEKKIKEIEKEHTLPITTDIQKCLGEFKKIQDEYQKIQQKLSKSPLTPKLNLDSVDIAKLNKLKDGKLKNFADDLEAAFKQLNGVKINSNLSSNLESLTKSLQKLRRLNSLTPKQKENGLKPFIDDLDKTIISLQGFKDITIPDFSKLNISKTNVKNLGELSEALGKIKEQLGNFDTTATNALESINKLVDRIDGLKNLSSILKDPKILDDLENLATGKSVSSKSKASSNADIALAKQTQNLDNRIEKWLQRNTAAATEFKERLREIQKLLRSTSGVSKTDFDDLYSEFLKIDRATVSAGKNTRSFFDALGKGMSGAAKYAATFASFYDLIRYFKQGIDIVKDYDRAFTEMKKVSHDAISDLRSYQKESFNTAHQIASVAKELQASTAGWMRLGEVIGEAKESAKQTSILFNVSEFENIDDATQGLVAVSQAYKDLDKSRIVDVLNNVGNNFAVSTEGLTQALQRSAAVLSSQGNDIYKASALIAAGNSVVQNPEMTGAGIRTIALRLSGTEAAKEELESLGESVDDYVVQTKSKTDEIIKAYTKTASNTKGISVLDSNGNLKETYDVLLDISKVYKEIQEEDKKSGTNRAQALVEFIAGKNRSNIAASILANPELLENAYQTALDSDGSAQRELDAKIASVEGQIAQLTNSAHEFWTAFLNGDSLIFLANLGEGMLKFSTELTNSLTSATQLFGLLKDSNAGGGGGITLLAGLIGGGFMTKNGVG